VIVVVDPDSATPPYEQLRLQITTLITSGSLGRGAQLPTIRQLAADLGVATGTVARAYRELERAGLIESRVRHGTRVRAEAQQLSRQELRKHLHESARAYVAAAQQLGGTASDIRAALETELRHAERT
jgi:GntR family transcriptional regulator